MRRKFLLLLALLVWAVPASAEGALMEEYAARLAKDLPTLLSNEAYVDMYTGGDQAVEQLLDGYAGHAWTKPLFDAHLSIDADALAQMAQAQGTDMPEGAAALMQAQRSALIANLLRITSTSEEIILGSIAQSTICYADPAQPDGLMTFLRLYADGAPLLYTLRAQSGAVALTAAVLPGPPELADCRSAAEVQSLLDTAAQGMLIVSEEPVLTQLDAAALSGDTLADRALSLVPALVQRLSDPLYAQVMMYEDDALLDMRRSWADGDYASPALMVMGELEPIAHSMAIWGAGAAQILSEEDSGAARALRQMLAGSVTAPLIVRRAPNTSALIVRSYTAVSAMYPDPQQPDGSGLFFLIYGEDVIEVDWQAENGVVMLMASYLPAEGFADCRTAADVTLYLMQNGLNLPCLKITTK